MAITPEQARAELARRELQKRGSLQANTNQTIEQQQPEKTEGGIFGKVSESAYQSGERNIVGNIFERPAAAIRSLLQGKGYTAGAVNPTNIPKFQDLAIKAAQQSTNPTVNAITGIIPSAAGLVADTVTNPAEMLTNLLGGVVASKTGSTIGSSVNQFGGKIASGIKKISSYESELQQAGKAKEAIDGIRDSLGTAKALAIKDVESVPVSFGFPIKSDRVIQAIKNPIYEVQFDKNGSIVKTVGNFDKVKEAVGDLVHSPALWEEAPKKEMQHIKQVYGAINESMKSSARNAGKPIDEALDAYSEFMDKYHLINSKIVDKAGNAMGNKLKKTFELGAEPAYKQAWQEVSKVSPEIKQVMDSMKNRVLLRNVLKASPYVAGIAVGGKVIKNFVSN